jgi:holo-[acyl-carrier protein] synthase
MHEQSFGHRSRGVGVDIIEVRRFRTLKTIDRIAELVLTEREYDIYCGHRDPALYLASRFAAKEAVIKACPSTLTFQDIEIVKEGKKPAVIFRRDMGVLKALVSLSHSEDYAAAFAVAM